MTRAVRFVEAAGNSYIRNAKTSCKEENMQFTSVSSDQTVNAAYYLYTISNKLNISQYTLSINDCKKSFVLCSDRTGWVQKQRPIESYFETLPLRILVLSTKILSVSKEHSLLY